MARIIAHLGLFLLSDHRAALEINGFVDCVDKEKRSLRLIGTAVFIPFLLAVPPVAGWFIGSWLDQRWGSSPAGRFVGIAFGFLVGCREVYKIVRKLYLT